MKKILIIEDDPIIRELIADLLDASDYEPMSAENGAVGLQMAQEKMPDLILCDIMMPDLDGYAVLSALRQELATSAIPFVFLSAKADKPDIRRGMALGADDYLTKPFRRDDLLEAIEVRLARQDTILTKGQDSHSAMPQDRDVARLEQAIANQEFELHYQPQVDLRTGAIVGAEALIRWQSPELGRVSPADFIPLAEQTGLIIPIGDWVLATACAQIQQWQAQGFTSLSIAVNMSSIQFNQDDVVERVVQCLEQSQLAPELLDVELTESLLVQNVNATVEKLTALREAGIQVSVDDFGTGYASLGYLQHFPFDTLKLDRCFVKDVNQNSRNAAIATAIIQMAHSLELTVIAEGVETDAEKAFLQNRDCDRMQGYLFSRPLPADAFEALLETYRPSQSNPSVSSISVSSS